MYILLHLSLRTTIGDAVVPFFHVEKHNLQHDSWFHTESVMLKARETMVKQQFPFYCDHFRYDHCHVTIFLK